MASLDTERLGRSHDETKGLNNITRYVNVVVKRFVF